MEFMLVWDWIDEDTFDLYEQHVDSFATKEELFEAKAKAEKEYSWQVAIGRLILSPAIGYRWADLDRLFQLSLVQFVTLIGLDVKIKTTIKAAKS